MNKIYEIEKKWHEVDQVYEKLETDFRHEILVKREVIPLIFVPGIMGSTLRRAGTKGEKKPKKKVSCQI